MASQGPSQPLRLDAGWLPHRYDPQHDAVHFVQADRELRRKVPFLTDEHLPGAAQPVVVGRRDALGAAPSPSAVHFIFHSAYCCSTLLANALDLPGSSSTLKEPVILNDIHGWRQRGAAPARVAEILDSSLALLSRPFGAGEATVIKPSNLLNSLASVMLAMRPAAGCILLYAPLDVYLGSIASKGLWGRLWVRDLLLKQLKSGFIDLGFEPEEHVLQSDLQVAAVGWLAQHQLFARLAAERPDRIRICNSEEMLDRPQDALEAAASLFGLGTPQSALAEAAEGAFKRHAKFGNSFSREDRLAAQRESANAYGDEIEKVVGWAEAVASAAGIEIKAPSTLLEG